MSDTNEAEGMKVKKQEERSLRTLLKHKNSDGNESEKKGWTG